MEVLAVDFPERLSKTSRSQRELAVKIDQTYNLTIRLRNGSERLLTEYVLQQGEPFGNADFNPSIQAFPGLPLPRLSPEVWLGLSDAERLQEAALAFSNLPVFLATVKRHQTMLNPSALELHHQLETSGVQCLGLANNLKSIMDCMGIAPTPAVPVEPVEDSGNFSKKLLGYQVCQIYKGWASRSWKDLDLLASKYPL